MKNFSLGIAIGATFNGVTAFGSAIKSTTTLNQKLQELKRERIDLGEKFGKASTEATKLNSKILGLTRNIKLMDKNFALGKGLEQYRNKFKESVLDKVALGTSVIMPLKVAIEFESSMADVKKVVDFDTPKQFKEMEDDILKLGRTLPITHDGIAKLVAAAGQAGIAREDLLAFATDAGKMAVAFDDLTADKAGEMMAKWRTGFKMSQDEVRGLADQINYLANESASSTTTLADILTSVGALGEVGGLSASSILALGTTMASVGVNQDIAATGIKNFMLSLVSGESATKSQEEAFKKLGLTSMEVAKGMQADSEGTVLKVLESVSKLDKVQQASTLQNLFGKESLGAISPLLTNLDNLKKNLDAVSDKTKYAGSVNKEYDTRNGTTANNLILLGNTISEISIRFGSLLLPAINAVIEPLRLIGVGISGFVENFPILSKVMGIAVVGAIGLSLGLSAIGFMGSLALTGLLAFGKGLLVVNSLFLANPIGLAIAGIALAAGLIYTYWEPIKTFFISLWESVSTIFTSSWNAISSFASNVWSSMSNIFISSWNGIKTFFNSLWNGIKNIFSESLNFLKDYLGWTPLGMIINNWGFITNFFSNFGNGIVGIVNTAWNGIKNIVSSVSNTAVNLAVSIWNPISGFFSSLWNTVTQIFISTWENIKTSFNGVVEFIKKPFEDFFNWIAGKFEWINNLIGSTIGVLKDIGNSIGEKATQFGNAVGDGLKTASNFFKVDKENEKNYMVFDEKQKENSGLNYATLPTDKKDITGNKDIQQTNHINVTVNNPKSTVDVQKGIQDAMANKKSNTQLSDQEF